MREPGCSEGMGVTSSGATPCRDRQVLPGCLSSTLPPCTAHGCVVPACTVLDGLQGTPGCPQGAERELGSFWAAHSAPGTGSAQLPSQGAPWQGASSHSTQALVLSLLAPCVPREGVICT